MSYSLTDAGEADMRGELKALEKLNEDLDQLASDARECDTLCPEAKVLIDAAWWFTEDAYRQANGHCSVHVTGWCACCHHYDELKAKARRFKGVL